MTAEMVELEAVLEDLALQEYFNDLVEHGFDTWHNLIHIQETDMATIGIKLGHRRKLQREIARRQGHDDQAGLSGVQVAPPQTNERGSGVDGNRQDPRAKRRYKRKVPRDPNAPMPPDSAYVAYNRAQRQAPEVANLSFVEIAKLVGDRWTHLPRDAKDVWKQNAEAERELYKSTVADYRQTEAYRNYREKIQSNLPKKEACESRITSDGALSQIQPPEPESDVLSSTTEAGVSKTLKNFLNEQEVGSDLAQYSSATPVC